LIVWRGRVAVALAGLVLAGCVGGSWERRTIDGPTPANPYDIAFEANLGALVAADRAARIDTAAGFSPRAPFTDTPNRALRDTRRSLAAEAAPFAAAVPALAAAAGPPATRRFDGRWRTARQTFYVAPAGAADATDLFAFPSLQARRSEIALRQPAGQAFSLDLSCDAPIAWKGRSAARLRVTVTAGADDAVLVPDPALTHCDAIARFDDGTQRHYRIARDDAADPALVANESLFETCSPPKATAVTPLQSAFWKASFLSQTCPFAPGPTRLLRAEREAFDAKVEVLLGTGLPARFYEQRDPGLPLDFSRAPPLSVIYVSYLDIKADFSGHVIDRLLRHHAARGTPIRVLTTAVMENGKDRAMIEALAADYPNVTLTTYAWKPPRGAAGDARLASLHRVQHVKMLAALSRQPGRSRAVIGGRNIHDGFLFREPVDLTAYPQLNQYERNGGLTLNYYSNWSDYDVVFSGDDAVRRLAAHLASFWHDDADTKVSRPFSVEGRPRAGAPVTGIARHFISVPYADGEALEAYYAGLIDAAQDRIEMINPYINPTPRLARALDEALARGVRIDIVGRIDMNGDMAGSFVTEMNELFVERYGDRVTIHEYKDGKVLLHAKIMMIDGELTVITSVNLNHRSFRHDTENGIAVLDRGFYARVKRDYDAFAARSKPVPKPEIPLFWRAILSVPLLRDAL